MSKDNELPDQNQFIGIKVIDDGDFELTEYIARGCYAHVFKGYSKSLNQYAAFKLIPDKFLAPGDEWQFEPQKANQLQHSSVVHCSSVFDWRDKYGVLVLKYEYVEGQSLFDYVRNNKEQITVPFIKYFLQTMLELFYELKSRGLEHGDFHAGNILVTEPSKFIRNSTQEFKVTDFGVNSVRSTEPASNDFEQLAKVVDFLLSNINYQQLSGKNKYYFNVINNHFSKHLTRTFHKHPKQQPRNFLG